MMSAFFSSIAVYCAFIRNAFLAMLAYRLRYFTGILTYLLFATVHYFIWQAIYFEKEAGAVINGFTFPEMVSYVTVAWISRSLYYSDIDYEIDDIVRTGQISIYLLRPVNFQLMMLTQAFGGTLFRGLFFTVPISLVLCLIFPIQLPPSLGDAVLFMMATSVAFLILAQLNFIIGLLAFSFKSIQGVMRAKYYLIQLLSGLLLPLTFFPDWAQTILKLLPFQTITYIPLRFYLGKAQGAEILVTCAVQCFWIVALFLIGATLWHSAMRKLTVQGG